MEVSTINDPKSWRKLIFAWNFQIENAILGAWEAGCPKTNGTVVSATELG
jgi:hypothetical protein